MRVDDLPDPFQTCVTSELLLTPQKSVSFLLQFCKKRRWYLVVEKNARATKIGGNLFKLRLPLRCCDIILLLTTVKII